MSDAEVKKPFYKNPYVVAFVVGIITITAIRPLTRHIPDPPPVIGQGLPSYEAQGPGDEAFSPDQLTGWVHVDRTFIRFRSRLRRERGFRRWHRSIR